MFYQLFELFHTGRYDTHIPNGRRIQYIIEECAERGVKAELVPETWTSKRCHRCGSFETRRTGQSLFWCYDCGLQYNADWNSAINIGSVFFAERLSRLGAVDSPEAGEDLASEASEPRSPHPFMGREEVTEKVVEQTNEKCIMEISHRELWSTSWRSLWMKPSKSLTANTPIMKCVELEADAR